MPSPDLPADPGPPRPDPLASGPEAPDAAGPGPEEHAADPPRSASDRADAPTEAGGLDDEPSLRAYLVDRWRAVPLAGRVALVAVVVGLVAWASVPTVVDALEGPTEEEVLAEAALARAQWAAARRQAPTDLGRDPIADALGPGDAERTDDRYADYYVHQADSTAFSVLVTSADFSPDLAVRRPDGVTIAASNLLRTQGRAEIGGLIGPGRFEIVVTSRSTRATGSYEVAVLEAGPIDSLYVDDDAVLDTLGAGPLRAGRYERVYGIATGSETPVVVRVVSAAFTPRVHLLGPNGEVLDATERVRTDSLRGAIVRYLPGWDAPYRLLVTSEEGRAQGPYAIEVTSVRIRDLAVGEQGQQSVLGDESALVGGRLLDTYRFRLGEGSRVALSVESEAFAPAFRLWRIDGRRREDVRGALNEDEAARVSYEGELNEGEYYLDVTTGGEEPTMASGAYGVTLTAEATEPDPPPPSADSGPLESRYFGTEVRRQGESGGSLFEVGVTGVALSYPAGSRTRVQLSVTVRSIDYTGNWAPWESFARQAYVVDDQGRRYTAAVAEANSPSGPSATPGTARRGIVVFYHPEAVPNINRLVLVASIGERTLSLPIPVQ